MLKQQLDISSVISPPLCIHCFYLRGMYPPAQRFADQLKQGKSMFARAYISERLPDWFDLHLKSMDSALVWHLEQTNAKSCREHQ